MKHRVYIGHIAGSLATAGLVPAGHVLAVSSLLASAPWLGLLPIGLPFCSRIKAC